MRPARTTRFLLLLSFAVACNSLESPTTAPVHVPLLPAAGVGADCSDCVLGPETFVRLQGKPTEFTRTLTGVAEGTYTIDVDELGSKGADGSVVPNGQIILDTRSVTGEVGPRHVTWTVQLSRNDVLEVKLLGRKGPVLQIAIGPTGVGDCLPDLPAPQLVVESGEIDGFGNNRYPEQGGRTAGHHPVALARPDARPASGGRPHGLVRRARAAGSDAARASCGAV